MTRLRRRRSLPMLEGGRADGIIPPSRPPGVAPRRRNASETEWGREMRQRICVTGDSIGRGELPSWAMHSASVATMYREDPGEVWDLLRYAAPPDYTFLAGHGRVLASPAALRRPPSTASNLSLCGDPCCPPRSVSKRPRHEHTGNR